MKLSHIALTAATLSAVIVCAQEGSTPPSTCKGVRDHVMLDDTEFRDAYSNLLSAAKSCTDCADTKNSTTEFPDIQVTEITKWKGLEQAEKDCAALADDLGYDGVEYDWCPLSVYMEDTRGVKRAVKKFYKNIFYECLPKICEDEKDLYEFFKQQQSPDLASHIKDCDASGECKLEYAYCDIIISREGKEVKEPMLKTLLKEKEVDEISQDEEKKENKDTEQKESSSMASTMARGSAFVTILVAFSLLM